MRPFIVTPPAGDLVDPAELMNHIRGNAEDAALIAGYQKAAVAYLDGYTGRLGRCILRQKWAFPLFEAPETIYLPFPDCREFKFERRDDFGDWSDVIGPSISVTGRDQFALADLPEDTDGLALTCFAGWEAVEDVPDSLKHAVSMLVGHWYESRAAVDTGGADTPVPLGFDAMISPYKNIFV